MDDHFHRPKHNDHAMRPSSDPRYHQPGPPPTSDPSQPLPLPPQRHYHQPGAAGSDRPRMSSGSGAGTGNNNSSSSSSRVLGGPGASAAYGAYYQDTAAEGAFSSGATLGYAQPTPDYTQDARQGFAGAVPSYTSLYGVQQTATPSSVFDPTASFGTRQHSGIPMMTPDVASGPYFSSDASGAAAAAAALHGQQQSMYHHPHQQQQQHHQQYRQHQHQQQHHQPASDRSAYGTSLPSSGGLGSQAQSHAQASSSSSATHADPSGAASAAAAAAAAAGRDYAETHESFAAYQRSLKDVFANIKSGHLATAADTLLGISEWLLTRVESLGLTHDDEELYEGRVKLWTDFNHAWLGLLAKQKEFLWAQRSSESQPAPPPPGSLVSFSDVQKLARELVRLCDGVERFGLVDYDYGVWEERIMAVLTECINLYSMAYDEAAGDVGSGPGQD